MAGQPGKIGKYDVLREIGRGGMGKVFAAVDPTIGRMVAIKQVTSVVSDDPDLLKRFYREAQSTGKLQHPNIVTLHDLGEQDGVPYLVMEYLEGESLERLIQERRPFTLAEKLNIIIQVCEGLAYAHQRQIIHRDVKPANIVVLNDGDVKIVDFGIAQFGNERFTRTGQVVGSLYYMSPEQLQDADIDSRSDIYSTGIVLYEFLTGSVPFRGKDPASTLSKILHEAPPSVASADGVYAAEIDTILQRALAKDRNTRYASMEDFAFDLRSLEEKLSQDLIANLLRAAESSVEGKQWDKAREQLRQVLKFDKQNRQANELLREVQQEIHRQQTSDQAQQLRAQAEELLAMRKWDEALAVLDQAVKIDGANLELVQFRDSVHHSNSLLADALRRAESAHRAGDLEGAKSAVNEALTVDPYDTTAKALKAILAKEIGEQSKRKQIDDLIAVARKEIVQRRFNAALEILRGAEALDPSLAEVQQLIRSATVGLELEKRHIALEQACAEIEELLNRDEYHAACTKADDALAAFPQDSGLLKLKEFAERHKANSAKGAEKVAAELPSQETSSSETRFATRLFVAEKREEPSAAPAPSPAPPMVHPAPAKPSARQTLLNRWTALAVIGLVAVGIGARYFVRSRPSPPATYVVNIDSEPVGATIQVANQTCVTPNCRVSLPAGEFKVDAQLNGYESQSQSVVVDPKNPPAAVKIILVAPPPVETAGFLVVKAGLEGADVLVDAQKRSQTVSGGTLRLSLDPGPHSVEVQKRGYAPGKPVTVQIEQGQDATVEFTLVPLSTASELVITRATPNVQVFADGRNLGRTDGSGVFAHAIEPGSHEIMLMQGDRRTNVVRKTFTAGGRLNVDGEGFIFAQPPRPMAIVVITHLPNGALVKVEGATYAADQSGLVRFDVVAGDHKLDVSAAGYKPKQISRSFPAGQQSLDGSLERADKNPPNDHDLIVTLVTQFEQAYSSKNLAEVCAMWPNCPRQSLGDMFKHARSVSQKLDMTGSLKMAKDSSSATAVYKRITVTESKGKAPTTVTGPVTIRFRKQNNFWQIDSME